MDEAQYAQRPQFDKTALQTEAVTLDTLMKMAQGINADVSGIFGLLDEKVRLSTGNSSSGLVKPSDMGRDTVATSLYSTLCEISNTVKRLSVLVNNF